MRPQEHTTTLLAGDAAVGPFGTPARYYGCIALLVALTVADGVLLNVLFDVWGERYVLYINEGPAVVYIGAGASILGGRACRRRRQGLRAPAAADAPIGGSIHEAAGAARPVPWYILVAIGLMNGTGNFVTSLGLPHTPGLTQSLLGLLGIPLVLGLSWAFLGRRPSLVAAAGAALGEIGVGGEGHAAGPSGTVDAGEAVQSKPSRGKRPLAQPARAVEPGGTRQRVTLASAPTPGGSTREVS